MPKPDRKPDPDYDTADAECDDTSQTEYDVGADADYEAAADPEYEEPTQLLEESEGAVCC